MDRVSIIKEEGEVVGFKVNNKEFYVEDGSVEAQVSELRGFNIGSIPSGFSIRPLDGNTIVLEGEISRDSHRDGIAYMDVEVYRKYWDHKYGAPTLVRLTEGCSDWRMRQKGMVQE